MCILSIGKGGWNQAGEGGAVFVHKTVVFLDVEKVSNQDMQELLSRLKAKDQTPPPGLQQAFLIESLDEPGKAVWLSFWDARSNAQAYLAGPGYSAWIAPLLPILTSGPEWYSYRVLE